MPIPPQVAGAPPPPVVAAATSNLPTERLVAAYDMLQAMDQVGTLRSWIDSSRIQLFFYLRQRTTLSTDEIGNLIDNRVSSALYKRVGQLVNSYSVAWAGQLETEEMQQLTRLFLKQRADRAAPSTSGELQPAASAQEREDVIGRPEVRKFLAVVPAVSAKEAVLAKGWFNGITVPIVAPYLTPSKAVGPHQ